MIWVLKKEQALQKEVDDLKSKLKYVADKFDGILQDIAYDVLSAEKRLERIYRKALIGMRAAKDLPTGEGTF